MTLSCARSPFGRTMRLMNNARTMKSVASTVVVLLRKSEVRRTPNTVPIFEEPKVPARPPPLLACIKIETTRNTLTRISMEIKNVYMIPLC